MTAFAYENRLHKPQARVNELAERCPEPTAKRKTGLAIRCAAVTVALAALLAGIMEVIYGK